MLAGYQMHFSKPVPAAQLIAAIANLTDGMEATGSLVTTADSLPAPAPSLFFFGSLLG